jgi:hypothetical protein
MVPAHKPFLQKILDIEPYVLLLFGFLWGTMLIVGSHVLNIDSLLTPDMRPFNAAGVRQVGYLAALNWSFTYAVLFPVSLYLMAESLRCVQDSLEELQTMGMVRDQDMQRTLGGKLSASWVNGSTGRGLLILILGAGLPILLSLWEWFSNNFLRLLSRGPTASYPDYDWGLAGLMSNWTHAMRVWNAGFDLLAFLCYGLLLSSSLVYFILLLDLARVIPTHLGARDNQLVPYLLPGSDPRRGFEVFAEPLQQMLAIALLSYLMCYLVRLEGAYMKSTGVTDLWTFVKPSFLMGVDEAKKKSVSGLASVLFDVGTSSVRGYLAQIASFILFAFSMQVMVITVRTAAKRAHDNAIAYLNRPGVSPLFGGSVAEERQLAETMTIWPLGYLKPNLILAILGLAAASIYWYRIGIYIVGLVVATLFIKLVARLKKLGS